MRPPRDRWRALSGVFLTTVGAWDIVAITDRPGSNPAARRSCVEVERPSWVPSAPYNRTKVLCGPVGVKNTRAPVHALDECVLKKIENHAAAVALYFMYYNFGRVHQTLRVTPAMEAGVSDHVWSIEEIVGLLG
jgi:hypothetical protein